MASAQVLPSSRKQEHLEAGKRRLEEFRKKKAAERAKKAGSIGQNHASDVSLYHKQPLETDRLQLMDLDGVGTSDGPGGSVEPFVVSINNDNNTIFSTKKVEESSLKDTAANRPSMSDYNASFVGLVRSTSNHDFKSYDASGFARAANVNYGLETDDTKNDPRIHTGSQGGVPYGISSDHSIALRPQSSQDFGSSSSELSLYGMDSFKSKENDNSLKDSAATTSDSNIFTSPPNSASSQLQTQPSNASTSSTSFDSTQPNMNLRGSSLNIKQDMHGSMLFNGPVNSYFGERVFSSFPSMHGTIMQSSESTGFNSDDRSSSNNVPLYSAVSEINSRRSRPSFLDSLNLPGVSLGTSSHRIEPEKDPLMPNASKSNGMDVLGSSVFQKQTMESETLGSFSVFEPSSAPSGFDNSMKFSVSSGNRDNLVSLNVNENGMERKHEFYSSKQNEEFAALEQHIEDLTQEKFSLQRALEASRALAESLAAENSSLTDSYNQQGSVVNQLKSDMEKLQEEIKAHLLELDSFKMEYANAQLECNAADERAKLLASEVIGLEEKALRLRSSELKLEKQLESSHAEVASYKKKMSSLEKDRQDLQSTIDALQEEKKLLQSKLRKASASGKSIDVSRSPAIDKKNVSTSTEDLGKDVVSDTSNREIDTTASLLGSDTPGLSMITENGQSDLEVSSVYVPPDQMRMIQNINALISELALEKEELVQTLASESSQCSKLKDLNKELSRKLEAQTQRLELLTAQSMANENIPARLPDSRMMQENTAYADEGDEVVERVLGWIMKLFPGGPSRRRTSKLL